MRFIFRFLIPMVLVLVLLCSSFAAAETTYVYPGFDPPLPPLSIFAETVPANLMHYIMYTPDLSIQLELPNGPVSGETIMSMLQNPDCLTSIFLVETDMDGYSDLLSSGLCQRLSVASFLTENVAKMPPVISALCYSDDTLYAVPVSIKTTAESGISSYDDLVELVSLPDDVTVTVAVTNPRTTDVYDDIFLHTAQNRFPPYIQSLLFPTH